MGEVLAVRLTSRFRCALPHIFRRDLPPGPFHVLAGQISVNDPISAFSMQALRVSESRYRRLFETARDGILLLNADTGQIEDVNPYLIEMLGYSHAEFLGKKLWEVGTFADIPQSKEMLLEIQTNGYVRYDDHQSGRALFGSCGGRRPAGADRCRSLFDHGSGRRD
jgi:PAS domain S-box-containing protein